MKNGEVLKWFFQTNDMEVILDKLSGPFCPNYDFQQRFECATVGDGSCETCWKKFLDLDDGLELTIRFPEEGEPHEKR